MRPIPHLIRPGATLAAACLAILGSTTANLHPASAEPALARTVVPEQFGRDLGEKSPGEEVRVTLTLRHNHPEELAALIERQNNPASSDHGRYLSTDEFRARFSPTAEQEAKVVRALQAAGFRITRTYPNRLMLVATAPTVAAENLFRTEIHAVEQASHGRRYGNVTAPTVPAELADLVAGVRLDNLVDAHTHVQPVPVRPDGTVGGGPFRGPNGGVGPRALLNSYRFPLNSGYDGSGWTAAVVIDSDVPDSDLNAYFSYYGIQRTGRIYRVSVDGAQPGKVTSQNSLAEVALDVETVAGLAPGANVAIYLIPELNTDEIALAYNQIVSDGTAAVVNSSFGAREARFAGMEQAIQEGAAKGVTFVASSGDNGGGDLEVPATEPNVLAVGGTVLSFSASTGNYVSEQGWSGSGGGVSNVFALPSYQRNVPGLKVLTGRHVPDVAFPGYYTDTYFGGGWHGLQGTSWSSPTFVALQIETDQKTGARHGVVNGTIYAAFRNNGYRAFRDVTVGNNGLYSTKTNYDVVTGIGSPIGDVFDTLW